MQALMNKPVYRIQDISLRVLPTLCEGAPTPDDTPDACGRFIKTRYAPIPPLQMKIKK